MTHVSMMHLTPRIALFVRWLVTKFQPLSRVTRPERPKGAKDEVKPAKGPPNRSWGPEGPLNF